MRGLPPVLPPVVPSPPPDERAKMRSRYRAAARSRKAEGCVHWNYYIKRILLAVDKNSERRGDQRISIQYIPASTHDIGML